MPTNPEADAPALATGSARPKLVFLVCSVFLASVSMGSVYTMLPFLAADLGGSSRQVGILGAVGNLTYALGLIATGRLGDRLSRRRLAMTSQAMLACVFFAYGVADRVGVLYICSLIGGMATTLYWPPIMAWFSEGQEGEGLNRRLSFYNVCWCFGMTLGPPIGGKLYEIWPRLPFLLSAGIQLLGAVALVCARQSTDAPAKLQPVEAPDDANADAPSRQDQGEAFRRIALISHFTAYVVVGLCRYHLPLLGRSLGIGEAVFGAAVLASGLSMTLTFAALGRTSGWHYRFRYLAAAQLATAGVLVGVGRLHSAAHMALAFAVVGGCTGFTYKSNLFYGASRSRTRARRMSLHEMLLGTGFAIGSLGGGVLNEHFGLRFAYPVCAVVVVAGVVVQMHILLRSGRAGAEDYPKPSGAIG